MWFTELNIILPNGRISGEAVTLCPKCSHTRKKKTDKCLSVNLDSKVWNCHNCGWKGKHFEPKPTEVIYTKPTWSNKTELSDKAVKWFENRSIRQNTLSKARITEGLEFMPQKAKECNTIQFNYFLEGVLTNVKYRTGDKAFKLHKGSELIPYNIDSLQGATECYITEGEIDCLSLIECGYEPVISVPNGANPKTNNLGYLDRFVDLFDAIQKIYICVDNDLNGRQLRTELAYRLGIEKCVYVEFETYKDANELLIAKGIQGVQTAINNAKDFPLEGIVFIDDITNDLYDLKINGLKQGDKIGLANFDQKLSFVRGYITTITGVPGHGKSDFVDQIVLGLMINHGWKTTYFSPENRPTQLHVSKMIRKIMGKHFNECSNYDIEMCTKFIKEYISFVQPDKDLNLTNILANVLRLKRKYGLDAFVIDAWNRLEHIYDKGENETKYIGKQLDELDRFCMINNLHCFLVAHPTKLRRDKTTGRTERANLYDISGSANFFNKTANGLGVYRSFDNDDVEVDILKVKFSHWGEVGSVKFGYHKPSGRYVDVFNDLQPWIQYKQQQMELPQMKLKPNKDFTESNNDVPDFLIDADKLGF